MKNTFNSVKVKKFNHNYFDLSHDVKLTCDLGKLIPVMCVEAVPGDVFKIRHQMLARFLSLQAPIMHNLDAYLHTFFVPNRIIWPNWDNFITPHSEGEQPNYPTIEKLKAEIGSTLDYLGFPVTQYDLPRVSALPALAYNKIYNEYYRDQNLIDKIPDQALDGDNSDFRDWLVNNPNPQYRAWRHDYFTACLPWPQKGPSVLLPVGGYPDVDVVLNSTSITDSVYTNKPGFPPSAFNRLKLDNFRSNLSGQWYGKDVVAGQDAPFVIDPNGTLKAKTSDMVSTLASIDNLRTALALQQYYERAAVAGTRYTEYLQAFFGVRPQDSRLQRPEYICGGKQPIIISEVIQTSKTEGNQPLGSLAGHGISAGGSKDKTYKTMDYGFIITILSVIPKAGYQDGLPKAFTRFDHLEFLNPMFAKLGEQAVKNQEIFYSQDQNYNKATFGYNPRYSEYRFQTSRVAGDMRTSLSSYHMNRLFEESNKPVLSADFINCRPTTRIFPVIQENQRPLLVHIVHNVIVKRMLPKYGTPALIV